MSGQLPTPEIPKRPYLIFLWADFYRRDTIHIVNPILKTVFVIGGQCGAQYYLYSPMYEKMTNKIQNWLPLLVLTCWQYDGKLNFSLEKLLMSVVLLWLLIVIYICYLLSIEQQISNTGWLFCKSWLFLCWYFQCWFRLKLDHVLYIFLWLIRELWDK